MALNFFSLIRLSVSLANGLELYLYKPSLDFTIYWLIRKLMHHFSHQDAPTTISSCARAASCNCHACSASLTVCAFHTRLRQQIYVSPAPQSLHTRTLLTVQPQVGLDSCGIDEWQPQRLHVASAALKPCVHVQSSLAPPPCYKVCTPIILNKTRWRRLVNSPSTAPRRS